MYQAPDRKKLRRDYLKTKRMGYAGIMLRCGFLILILSSFFLVPVGLSLFGPWPAGKATLTLIICLVGPVLVGSVWIGVRLLSRINQQAAVLRNLPVVPPITPNALPAEEILVRGSEQPPVAQSEMLLRAAKEVETPKDELLRVAEE